MGPLPSGPGAAPAPFPALLSTPGMFVCVPAVSQPGGNARLRRSLPAGWTAPTLVSGEGGDQDRENQLTLNSVKCKTVQICMKHHETLLEI